MILRVRKQNDDDDDDDDDECIYLRARACVCVCALGRKSVVCFYNTKRKTKMFRVLVSVF